MSTAALHPGRHPARRHARHPAPHHARRRRARSPPRSTPPASTPSRSPTATGWPAAALNYGPGAHTDWEWIEAAADVVTNAPAHHAAAARHRHHRGPASARYDARASARCASPPTAPRPTSPPSTSPTARELGMDVSGFLMMSHMAPPDELAAQAKLMESYGAHCVYVTDSGGRLTMDGVRDRVRAYRDVLDPDTEIGIHAHQNLSLVGRQLASSPSRRASPASTPRWPATGAGAGNCPIEPFIAVADLHGLAARLRPVRAAGRRRRPRPAAAGPPGPGRPRDADPRLRRRLLQLPAPRRDAPPRATASTSATSCVEVGRRGLVGGQEDMIVDIALDLIARRDQAGQPQPEGVPA